MIAATQRLSFSGDGSIWASYDGTNWMLENVTTPLISVNVATHATALGGALTIAGNVGFFGGAAAAKPTITGSKGANAALTSLLAGLASLGILTDSTT